MITELQRQRIRSYSNIAYAKKYGKSPYHKAIRRVRSLIQYAFFKNCHKCPLNLGEFLGCSTREFFYTHLMGQAPDINWNNLKTWKIRFRRDWREFDLTTKQGQLECFHYSNYMVIPDPVLNHNFTHTVEDMCHSTHITT